MLLVATQAERRDRTRAAIIGAATELFAGAGYSATSVTDILSASGVSRGALYHHFPGKEDVFAAVYAEVSADAVAKATRRPQDASRLEALLASCLAWIEISSEPAVARILFVEGPKALGWERCRNIEEEASLGRVRMGLKLAAQSGEIVNADLDLTARAINAALAEVALTIHLGNPPASKAAARRTITALISGLAS